MTAFKWFCIDCGDSGTGTHICPMGKGKHMTEKINPQDPGPAMNCEPGQIISVPAQSLKFVDLLKDLDAIVNEIQDGDAGIHEQKRSLAYEIRRLRDGIRLRDKYPIMAPPGSSDQGLVNSVVETCKRIVEYEMTSPAMLARMEALKKPGTMFPVEKI